MKVGILGGGDPVAAIRRYAERIALKEPIVAMIADMEVRIVEISLIGGRIEHIGRLNMN